MASQHLKMFNLKNLTAFLFLVGFASATIERRAATNVFPTPPTTSSLSKPITVAAGQTFTPPQSYTRYDRGSGACKGQSEGGDSDAVFLLQDGATLSHVVIGPNQSEGVHCLGSCTLDHVYFEDVCEDAITLKQTSGTSHINYGGHNGGGTVIINSFYVEDFGKLYRSINDVWAVDGSALVGINTSATIRTTKADSVKTICQKYTGNNSGAEPTTNGSGPDSKYCLYATSDISS
ncbi:hypothetical protein D9619_004863 [Psilocybe cf. subviscida]|uniref:Pectate lyase n=1 Tax=Psilocybe cf. subviscida TaxID=2480587 RepID=A0A8H5BQH4_9AGAR|nr:hypothetical protein D9619_004863 [Psilocybe cf. subviscida]